MSVPTTATHEGLPIGKLATYGLQHVVAFYAGAVLVPIIIAGAIDLPQADLVKLITVHKSKGLEYPVVCLPFGTSFRAVSRKYVKAASLPDPGKGWFRSRGGSFLRGSIIGHGEVPVQACLGILKRAGYDGTLSIEFEGMENPVDGIAISLENLRRFEAAC